MIPPHPPLHLPIKVESDRDQSPVFRYERHLCHPHPTVINHISNYKKDPDWENEQKSKSKSKSISSSGEKQTAKKTPRIVGNKQEILSSRKQWCRLGSLLPALVCHQDQDRASGREKGYNTDLLVQAPSEMPQKCLVFKKPSCKRSKEVSLGYNWTENS